MLSISDRVKGMFLGQAAGDALGLSGEFLTKRYIKETYGRIDSIGEFIQDSHRSLWRAGEWTDDTDHFLIVANSIIKTNSISPHVMADGLYTWAKNGGRGIGKHTMSLFLQRDFLIDPYLASNRVWEQSNYNSAPNGAIMRTGVLGALPTQEISEIADCVAKATHYDPRCRLSCALICLLIQNEIYHHSCPLNIINKFKKTLPENIKDEFIHYTDLATSSNISDLNLDGSLTPDSPAIGYTLKTMAAAIWSLLNSKSFESGIIDIVNEGGDSDTNGAVAGALLGAKYGHDGVPKHWQNALIGRAHLLETAEAFMSLDLAKITFSREKYDELRTQAGRAKRNIPMPVFESRVRRPDAPEFEINVVSLSRISNTMITKDDLVISISSPGNETFLDFPCEHLSLSFSDISSIKSYLNPIEVILYKLSSTKYGSYLVEWLWLQRESGKGNSVPFRRSHANKIKAFISKNIAKAQIIYIHCDFGRSRSAAIAEYLHITYGVKVKFCEPDIRPNKLVMKTLGL